MPKWNHIIEELEKLAKETEEEAGYKSVKRRILPKKACTSPAGTCLIMPIYVSADGTGWHEVLPEGNELSASP
jgi:hypothetical protein